MTKSQGAFRTISEVSDWLDTPAHVLRFWESKFTQIKPVKRAGGRRYYRPEDMALLGGIKTLLHDQGMTIKGVQKILRDNGNRHVMAFGPLGLPDGGQTPEDAPQVAPQVAPEDAPQVAPAVPQPAPPVARTTGPPAPPAPRASPPPITASKADPMPLAPALLAALARADRHSLASRSQRISPLLARLTVLRDRMARDAATAL